MSSLQDTRPTSGLFSPKNAQQSFEFVPSATTGEDLLNPAGYTGLARFHKYWGKKPVECFTSLVNDLTCPGDLVLDPFLGGSLAARETLILQRRFVGIDINPIAIELSSLFVDPPAASSLEKAFAKIQDDVREPINESYKLVDGRVATHYLWDRDALRSVWIAGGRGTSRLEFTPTRDDIDLVNSFADYSSQAIRPLRLFHNSRINTTEGLTLAKLFKGRALRNIDLLLAAINRVEDPRMRRALLLVLTAASGQMSNMVFAITGRGKTKGSKSEHIEVGSWVIGYWRPPLHFEVNVWQCFRNKYNPLVKSLKSLPRLGVKISSSLSPAALTTTRLTLCAGTSQAMLKKIPDSCVNLVLTDPPHSDRIPYLELSEMWNALAAFEPCFEDEIVVSNARGRNKNDVQYHDDMSRICVELARVLVPGGLLAVIFNARDISDWKYLSDMADLGRPLRFEGSVPMAYSTGSVVQDNRNGSLKQDYVLFFSKHGEPQIVDERLSRLRSSKSWTNIFPKTAVVS